MRAVTRLRDSQLSSVTSQTPQPQAQPHQPTEAEYQALLSTTSESSLIAAHSLSILPRFAHTSGVDIEAHRIPQHTIAFVEQNRDHLQRTAQDKNGFRAALTSTKAPQLDNRAQFNQGSTLQAMGRPPQLMASQLQQLQRQGLAPQGKPDALQTEIQYHILE
ncbi:hypothetical protein BGW80DRAFT_339639 [Lactifluus volemus]|nr:hypothetical protein BGW80DRAFT_339639 [Lactifluus volemus]